MRNNSRMEICAWNHSSSMVISCQLTRTDGVIAFYRTVHMSPLRNIKRANTSWSATSSWTYNEPSACGQRSLSPVVYAGSFL